MPPHRVYTDPAPLHLRMGGELARHEVAYETWGGLNAARDNAVFVCAGISASSHVRSNAGNPARGYWEEMVGPGLAIDTDRFFVVAASWLGGCSGTTGPSSADPRTGKPYALSFPILTLHDLGASAMRLLEGLGVARLHASVGSSLGGMVVLAMAVDFAEKAGRIASLSGTAWTRAGALAIRYLQRACILLDPEFRGGSYPAGGGPRRGLSLARQLGFTTYRSVAEWNERFGRERRPGPPAFTADYAVETYLEHQGKAFAERYDPDTYLYLSKAMDLFDLRRPGGTLREGLDALRERVLVIGVDSDLLMPIDEQEELFDAVRGNHPRNRYVRVSSLYGHDAFLKETALFTPPLGEFLEG
ncbi:MAG: homoserine O-acetyltransferase MetX [Planctomycetota bacterium]